MRFAVALVLFATHSHAASHSQTIPQPRPQADFGKSVAAVGNFMAVSDQGRVHLYERNAGTWETFVRKNYLASPASNGGRFGTRVLMPDQNTLIVSDPSYDAPTPTGGTNSDQGAVFVFGRDVGGDNSWGLIRQITATDHQLPNGALSKRLGEVMAVSDGRLVVSAAAGSLTSDQKFFYVFEKDRGGANQWGQVMGAKLEGTTLGLFGFGSAVALSGDLIIIGSPGERYQPDPLVEPEIGRGALFFFGRNQGGTDRWGLLPGGKVYAPDGATNDFFGWSLSLDGNRMAVGAPGRNLSASLVDAGVVYLLEKSNGAWNFTADRISPLDAAAGDEFGSTVRLRGNLLAASAAGDDVAGSNDAGSASLFTRASGSWAAVSGSPFSLGNMAGISGILSDRDAGMHLDEQRLFLRARVSSSGRALGEIDVAGEFVPETIGRLTIDATALRFIPARSGLYQLRASTDLANWTDLGAPFQGNPGTPVIVPTGVNPSVPRRFFRVESR